MISVNPSHTLPVFRTAEEKDRRIHFLKEELDSMASERTQEREGYRMKLDQLVEDRDQEISRIKERHENMMNRLVEDHEKELQWSQRKREEEIAEVKALCEVHQSIQDLVKEWKNSAEEMHEIQSLVTSKQGRMMNESVVDVQERERSVSSLLKKLDSFVSLREQLSGLAEEQRDLMTRERREMVQERRDWERDQKQQQQDLQEERHEMRMQRESLDQESRKLHDQKLQAQKDQDAIARERQEVEQEHRQVQQQISLLHDLEAKSHNLATSQILLDQDKGKLLHLAQQVMRRAEELEVLANIASRERDEGLAARTRSEALLRDLETRSAVVQEKLETVEEKERLLKDQIRFVESERLAVKEMKDRIVCSLCNSGLQSYGRLPEETPLLIWQMTGQRESALLAQEAAFLERLRSGHNMTMN